MTTEDSGLQEARETCAHGRLAVPDTSCQNIPVWISTFHGKDCVGLSGRLVWCDEHKPPTTYPHGVRRLSGLDAGGVESKDSSRDWPEDFGDENGRYLTKCQGCGEMFEGHKRRVICKRCASPAVVTLRGSVEITVFRDGKVLAVNSRNFDGFCGVGGKVEPGESFEQAARRELMEETGCEALSIKFIAGHTLDPIKGDDATVQWYCAGLIVDIGQQEPHANEAGTIPFWTTKEALIQDSLFPEWYSWWFGLLDRIGVTSAPAAVTGEWTVKYDGQDYRIMAGETFIGFTDDQVQAYKISDIHNLAITQLTARAEAAEAKRLKLECLSNQLYTDLREHRPLSNKDTRLVDEVQSLLDSIEFLRGSATDFKEQFLAAEAKLKVLEEK